MKQRYDTIDLMKVILAFLVVALHQQPFLEGYEVLRSVARLAVPLFFITSGFFFFKKQKQLLPDRTAAALHRRSYLRRCLRLYLCWFLILLPVTLWYRRWHTFGLLHGILRFLVSFLLGSTFVASWYLMALIIGILLVSYAGARVGNRTLFGISLCFYLFCCMFSGYGKLLGLPLPTAAPLPYNSFPAALVWIVIGKRFADADTPIQHSARMPVYLLSVPCYFLEYYLCVTKGWANSTDALLMMLPICELIFYAVISCRKELPYTQQMRTVSTVTYCLHGSLALVVRSLFKRAGMNLESNMQCFMAYLTVAVTCLVVSLLVDALRKKRAFRWLSLLC